MTSAKTSLPGRFTRTDGLLFALAVLGLALFVWALPRHHPDATAHYRLGATGADEAAAAFLSANGYATDGLVATAELHRATRLLDSLQANFGRPATVQLLRSDDAVRLPAYYWEVAYDAPPPPEDAKDPTPQGNRERFRLYLTLGGKVWDFEQRGFGLDARRYVDRAALHAALAPATETGPALADFRALPDSVFLAGLHFDLDAPPRAAPEDSVLARLRQGQAGALDAGSAAALARHHLARTVLQGLDLRVDSVWALAERDERVAVVRFVSAVPLHGQTVQAEVEVTATGALQEVDVTYNPIASSSTSVMEIVSVAIFGGLYALLVIALLILFFRRLMARLIDVKPALVDAAILGMLFGVLVALNKSLFEGGEMPWWGFVLAGLGISSVMAGLTSLFFFILSSATDSIARAVWAKKLFTTSLMRQGDFRNRLVGTALLRGTALAGLLLGVVALFLIGFPQAPLDLNDAFLFERTLQPMIWTSFYAATVSYLTGLVMLLGVGTLLYRLTGQGWAVVGGLTVVLALTHVAAVDVAHGYYAWGVSAAAGAVVGYSFWRYDLLTCFVALFLSQLLWELSEGWLVAGSPAWLDVGMAGLFIATVLLLGFVGLMSGKSGREVEAYVPAYIEEMTGQERLKRELEIAHQVQESFLPRRMPRVDGLDVAGMCLAAQEVGGDYYDFVELGPGRLAVAVGDVSGKGIQAAFYMTLVKGFLRTLCRDHASPAEVLRRLNILFCENAPKGMFISMIYGVVDVEARTFTFARAGHNPIIVKRSPSQQAELVQPAGLGIGLVTGPVFDDTIEELTLPMRAGDVLVFYTDGFSEAMNLARDLYGDDRLAEKVGQVGRRSAGGILRSVTEDVHHFIESAGRHDDMTMVVVKLTPPTNHTPAAPRTATHPAILDA